MKTHPAFTYIKLLISQVKTKGIDVDEGGDVGDDENAM